MSSQRPPSSSSPAEQRRVLDVAAAGARSRHSDQGGRPRAEASAASSPCTPACTGRPARRSTAMLVAASGLARRRHGSRAVASHRGVAARAPGGRTPLVDRASTVRPRPSARVWPGVRVHRSLPPPGRPPAHDRRAGRHAASTGRSPTSVPSFAPDARAVGGGSRSRRPADDGGHGSWELVDDHGRRGRNGIGALRLVLEEWMLSERPPDSVLEIAVRPARQARGPSRARATSTGWRSTAKRYRIDAAWPELMLAVEVDGWETRKTFGAFQSDTAPAERASSSRASWTVIRFTWTDVVRRPGIRRRRRSPGSSLFSGD